MILCYLEQIVACKYTSNCRFFVVVVVVVVVVSMSAATSLHVKNEGNLKRI